MTAEENVELHRLMITAADAGRTPGSSLAADFVMRHRTSSITDYTYRGRDGWRDWLSDLFEEFSGPARLRIEQIVVADDAVVVATYCLEGTSVHDAAPIEFRWAGVTWFANRRATRSIGCTSVEEALNLCRRRGAPCPADAAPARRPQRDIPLAPRGTPGPRSRPASGRRRGFAGHLLALLGHRPAGELGRPPLWI